MINNLNNSWILTCFGTAVGAGILFLPISTGLCSVWSVLFLILIILPFTYIAHRGITRIVASCPKQTDIIGAVEYDLGHTASFIVSIFYFLSIISICVGYATSLTNMLNSLLIKFNFIFPSRSLLTFIVIILMTSVMLFDEKIMIKITSTLTFPLIILLFLISVYMIPNWNFCSFHKAITLKQFIKDILLILPTMVFAMNFSPVCSLLGAFYNKKFLNKDEAVKNSDYVVKWTSVILLVFVMFFVLSMFFSITPQIISDAKFKNIDALTAVAIAYKTPGILYVLPIISFLAISSSYFGHFAGTREGLSGIIIQIISNNKKEIDHKKIKLLSTIILIFMLWILAVCNLSILSIIGLVSAPMIAIYAYLLPIVLMKKVPRLKIYQSKFSAIVFVMGIITIVAYFLGENI